MTCQRLTILGVGLLGGSLGLAVKSAIKSCKITGYGHRKSTLEYALAHQVVDSITTDPTHAVQGADFVVLCTPVGTFDTLLPQIAKFLSPGTIVTDVGSTKRSVCRLAEQTLPSGVHFVGSHPMAGSEKRGIEAARADL